MFSIVLAYRGPSPQQGLKEIIIVAGWYIWWQRREAAKGESVAPIKISPFSIQAITANYGASSHVVAPKENGWTKPPRKTYKMRCMFFPLKIQCGSAVIRNSKGAAMAGGAWPSSNILDISTA
jgi:hypothetical protein